MDALEYEVEATRLRVDSLVQQYDIVAREYTRSEKYTDAWGHWQAEVRRLEGLLRDFRKPMVQDCVGEPV